MPLHLVGVFGIIIIIIIIAPFWAIPFINQTPPMDDIPLSLFPSHTKKKSTSGKSCALSLVFDVMFVVHARARV